MELRQRALQALCTADPSLKVAQARELLAQCASLDIAAHAPPEPAGLPGRPAKPELIHPAKVPRRSPFKPEGSPHCCMPSRTSSSMRSTSRSTRCGATKACRAQFYSDWVRVAAEEAYHFSLLRDHLISLGWRYGDFPAHDNLWAMCEKTKHDIVARMALVPRTLEARGLDATPIIQEKLRRVGSPEAQRAVEILDIILADEIGHVAIGNHWYRWLCEREGLDPVAHYGTLVERYEAPRLYPPFNEAARKRAGFSDEELAWLLG